MNIVENLEERYDLSVGRIEELAADCPLPEGYRDFFQRTAAFIGLMKKTYEYIKSGRLYQAPVEELKENNKQLYADVLPENYKGSFANPEYAVHILGSDYGQLLSFLYSELRSMIVFAYEQDQTEIVIRMELFLEIYGAFACAYEETKELPEYESVRQIIYWFVTDYSEPESEKRLREQLCPEQDFAVRIIMDSNLEDCRYLYYFGEYITENEIKTAEHLNQMALEEIQSMAVTYTEGYRMGFEVCGKDISKKKMVNIRFKLGFERMIREAVLLFRNIGLNPVIYRAGVSIFQGKSIQKMGYYGAIANKQYEYDHKDDQAIYLDKQYMNRKLEVMRLAYESLKQEALLMGGPAVLETFGDEPFAPVTKESALQLSDRQRKLSVEYMSANGAMQNEFIPGEDRSFTIIAFPLPSIGNQFDSIFNETVKINTLDYQLYQRIQQTIIDTLDRAASIHVKGMGQNKTDLNICMQTLSDPEKETNFENCVADVNIPVGEVFTSPKLKGTEGILHVTRVFLGELEYRDLELTFKNGMVENYTCHNFLTEEENKNYVKDNVLFHHETLPMGEFAIGTNTTAYMMARTYGIEDKLPILIAEKMGPHFAVGDTCYTYDEDNITYNPDGKAITARENEVSALRNTDIAKAYRNCHTDITIPYDEILELSAVTAENEIIPIISRGKFVLKGCEELNKPFDLLNGC